MNNKDLQIIYFINKHYQKLKEELDIICDYDEFQKNTIVKKAIILDLIQIGENVNKLSEKVKQMLNKFEVKGVIGFRNYLVHGDGFIDDQIIWEAIQYSLPKLIDDVNKLIK